MDSSPDIAFPTTFRLNLMQCARPQKYLTFWATPPCTSDHFCLLFQKNATVYRDHNWYLKKKKLTGTFRPHPPRRTRNFPHCKFRIRLDIIETLAVQLATHTKGQIFAILFWSGPFLCVWLSPTVFRSRLKRIQWVLFGGKVLHLRPHFSL